MTTDDICFIDLETTGLDFGRNAICQIGAVIGEHEFFSRVLVPRDAIIDDRALEVNGESRDGLFDPSRLFLVEALQSLMSFSMWNHAKLAGAHNPAFDLGFIRHMCYIYDIPFTFSHRYIDTHTMFVDRFGFTCNLDDARTMVGLTVEPKPHNALTGAKCAQQLYLKLKGFPCIQQ